MPMTRKTIMTKSILEGTHVMKHSTDNSRFDTDRSHPESASHIKLRLAALWTFGVLAMCVAVFGASSVSAAEHEYVGVAKCKTCHKKEAIGDQYGKWLDSKHSKAFKTLGTDKAKQWAAKAGVKDPQNDGACVRCHVTAYKVPAELVSAKFDRTEGVQCESCHGPGKDYRKKKIMMDRDAAIANGLVIPDEKVCVTCHNDKSPAWDPARYTKADGTKTGFDFKQAAAAIAHPVPEGYDSGSEGEAD
jgi:Cytochrome c554 and c-prime